MAKLHLGEFIIVLFIVVAATWSLYWTLNVIDDKPQVPVYDKPSLEKAHAEKHKLGELLAKYTNVSNISRLTPKAEESKQQLTLEGEESKKQLTSEAKNPKKMFVLTTGKRLFRKPTRFDVEMVFGKRQSNAVGDTYDEGYGPKPKWPEGARRVSEGHITIWKRIAKECPGWCLVSEDDAEWPDIDMPDLPEDGFVSFFKESVCNVATKRFSYDFRRVVKDVVRGVCMPYGAVAYAMHRNFAKLLLDALPMKKPIDHFLWTQSVKHNMGYVSNHYNVKHKKGKSLRESVRVKNDKTSFDNIQLLEDEGHHKKFDKSWSKYNKFVTNQGFLKLGKENVAHEYLYWCVAFQLGFDDIFVGKPSVHYECKDTYSLTSQVQHAPKTMMAPLYGILTPYVDSMKGGWDQSKLCRDLNDERVVKMLIVDYLVGHPDRPANCHAIDGKVYAIDNDGVTMQKKLPRMTNNVQEYILNKALGETEHNEKILNFVRKHIKTTLSTRLLRRQMGIFNTCDRLLFDHIQDLLVSIEWRFNQLMSQVKDMQSESSQLSFGEAPAKLQVTIEKDSDVKIAVAIPTYNRFGYVRLCGEALQNTVPVEDIYIFDDHSSSFTREHLKEWFLTDNIFINQKRLRPDAQARKIMKWFVESDYDWIVTLDSDLIVRPDWLSILKEHLSQTEGVVSLYHSSNSNNHRTLGCQNNLCQMSSLGNAGIVWSKLLAKKMLSDIKDSRSFDWAWSGWLKKRGIHQYAFENSLVLHIGMRGTWGADSMREKSIGFDLTTLSQSVREISESYLAGLDPSYIDKYTRKYSYKKWIETHNKLSHGKIG